MASEARECSVTDDVLEEQISSVLANKDLTSTSLKEVRAEIEKRLNLSPGNLDEKKETIKYLVAAHIQKLQASQTPASPSENEVQAEVEEPEQPLPKRAKRKTQERNAAEGKGKAKGPSTKERQSSSMTRKEFMKKATAITVTAQVLAMAEVLRKLCLAKVQIGDKKVKAVPKQFSTGSVGFMASTKVVVDVGGVPLTLQCGLNLPVIGSKEWSDGGD
eukprot:symbB.v1.2.001588.t1/scaffold88.1/size340390/23